MIAALSAAGHGWSKILAGKPGWEDDFSFDADGMNQGFIVFGISVLIAIALVSLRIGFPPPDVMALLVAGHLVPLLALIIATSALKRIAGLERSIARFLTPGLYLLALMKIIEGFAVLFGMPLAGAIFSITGILAFRLARANDLSMAAAVGYGVAVFVLLALLPIALYMLVNAQ